MNGAQGLGQVDFAPPAPIADAKGRVRGNLNLGDNQAGAEGVNGAGRQVVKIAVPHLESLDEFEQGLIPADGFGKALAGNTGLDALEDIPA